MVHDGPHIKDEPGLGKTLRNDMSRGDFQHTVRREFRELKDFFLTENRRTRLKTMGFFRRWFWTLWWLLKSLFLMIPTVSKSHQRERLLLMSRP